MSETVRLIALGPGTQFYGTRALVAGDPFEMPRDTANVLILLGKAKLAEENPQAPEPKKVVTPEPRSDDINDLRAQATRMGIIWDGRWGADRLKHEIGLIRTK